MIVTWVTQDYVNESVVEYGIDAINQVTMGNQTIFTDWGVERRKMTIHRVLLQNLKPGTTYRNRSTYSCSKSTDKRYGQCNCFLVRLSLWFDEIGLVTGVLVHDHVRG